MSTSPETIETLMESLKDLPDVSYRKMFGEYALYCDTKVVALVCDDQLFIKPTEAGKSLLEELHEASPYPGAKLYFQIPEDQWKPQHLVKLFKATADELPLPKPKK